jgi:hypothetical protein
MTLPTVERLRELSRDELIALLCNWRSAWSDWKPRSNG